MEFTLNVLERLAERYGKSNALFGIEPVNEPISEELWSVMNVQERYKPVDWNMAQGSCGISKDFLRWFYLEAYWKIRKYMHEDKAVVLHDGFDLMHWKNFMQEEEYKNVWLDTHQYLMSAEAVGCEQSLPGYLRYIEDNYRNQIREMEQYFPVICGEWCLFNSMVVGKDTKGGQSVLNGVENASVETMDDEKKREVYRVLADAQLEAWSNGHGYCFWSYKLLTDTVNSSGWIGWDAWDLGRSYDFKWFPKQ